MILGMNDLVLIFPLIEIIAIFIIPLLLMRIGIIPFSKRNEILAFVTIVATVSVIVRQWPLESFGVSKENPFQYSIEYALFTIISALILWAIIAKYKRYKVKDKTLILQSFFSGLAQEFIFRGYLFHLLMLLTMDPLIIILSNTIIFTVIHSIYDNTHIDMLIIPVAGLCFATMYWFYPNLILISISHSILNYMIVRNGFYMNKRWDEKMAI